MCFREISIEYNDTIDGCFDLGRMIGSSTRDLIERALPLDDSLQKLLIHVADSSTIKERVRSYQRVLEREAPKVYAELKGLAEGSGVSFDTVFISNYRKEILHFHGSDKGCTDLHADMAWGHNEDYSWSPEFRPLTLVKATRISADSTRFTWFSIVYPLCLGGMTVGMNSSGLVFSVDNLTPSACISPEIGALSSQVICRIALESEDVQSFIAAVSDKRLATGRGFTCSSFLDPAILYIETGPGGISAIHCNPKGHSNHYIYLDIDQKVSESSEHRLATIHSLGTIRSTADIIQGLSDTSDIAWPIFRSGKQPDSGYTDLTALIDLEYKEMALYYKVPTESCIPDKVIKFSSFSA